MINTNPVAIAKVIRTFFKNMSDIKESLVGEIQINEEIQGEVLITFDNNQLFKINISEVKL